MALYPVDVQVERLLRRCQIPVHFALLSGRVFVVGATDTGQLPRDGRANDGTITSPLRTVTFSAATMAKDQRGDTFLLADDGLTSDVPTFSRGGTRFTGVVPQRSLSGWTAATNTGAILRLAASVADGIIVSGTGVHLHGLIIAAVTSNTADSIINVNLAAHGFTMTNCLIVTENLSHVPLTIAGADDVLIANCHFANVDPTADTDLLHWINVSAASNRLRILNNTFSSKALTLGINLAAACKDIEIRGNQLSNSDTDNVAGLIDCAAGTTGVICDNRGLHGYHAAGAALDGLIDPASCANCENYANNVTSEAGGLIPATRST
jgi:hypothetical protein